MLSMYDNPEYVQKAMQVGARGYVLKDAPAAEIVAAIEAVSAGGTFLSPAVSKKLFRNQAPRPLLTPRESQILTALGRGESSKQIARDLGLERAHGGGAPPEHQAAAGHRRAGGTHQVRGGARAGVRAGVSDALRDACHVKAPPSARAMATARWRCIAMAARRSR
jgi:FixJ family two-component response regulator